ncbi:smooth muscle caldesmon [Rhodotorula toruloides]|uniref:Smooth muscle caldesmon n=1 Tax=Rhodotorula toruloides TaxID=5286 RepID=A0A511KNW4_RHOTO|nr:smooth muscle caldesmon [Rhodotorula toruloides]
MKPSLAELQRQADEARALAQEAEREAQRRREREMEEKRKSPAEAEAAAAKRKEDEGERVRAEVEAKERARLEVEEREWCRLEAEVEERPQRQAKEGRAQHEAEETARREREANTEADRIEKERLATERKEKERKAREEARKRGEAEKKARLDAELEAQTKARQEAKRREDEREEKKPLEEERKAKEAEAKAKLDAELEAQEKEREGEMRKEKLRKEEERKAVLRAQWDAQQAERERRAVAAREEEAKKVEREQHELARLAALARKRKEEEERRKEAAEEEAKQKADEEAKKEKERQAEEAMWRKEIPPLWETWDTTTYDWTVPPDSPAMSAIVRDREQVFSKQRETGTPEIQLTSRKVIAQHMATYTHSTGGRAVYAYRIRDYESFCRSVDVPPWPLSTVMIALFCLATAPRGFALSTSNNIVTALRNSTRDCVKYWQELPGFSDLSSWPKADQALMEWKNMLNPIPDEEEESAVDTPRGGFPSAAEAAFEVEEGDEDEDEEEEEDGADEEDEDGADLDEETDADTKGRPAESGKKVRRSAPEMKKFALDCTKKYPLPDMPGMPHPGQSFANLQALLKAVAVALVPTLGVTPALTNRIIACKRRKNGCPFRISTVKRADGKVVVKGNSVYAHNHGPDQRLVADPSWRPQMRNDGVAAAVAKHDKLAANKKGKKRLSDSSELPVAKHPRRESETVKSDFSKRKITVKAAPATQDEPADPVSSTSAKDASSPPAPLDAPRTEVESIQAQHDYENMEFDNSSAGEMGRTAVKAASPAAEPAHALVKADSSTPAAQLPSRPSLPPGHSPAAPSSFRPDLEAFLFAVHPSLAPLTDPLVAAGITSHRLLALFAGMERSSRHSLYEYLRIEGDMPMLDAAAVEALDEACSMAQSSQWAVR